MMLWPKFVWALVALFLLAGCDSGPAGNEKPAPPPKINVLVAVYPMVEMVKRIGGEHVDVQWLAEAGQKPDDIEATPDLRRRTTKASLVVTSGPWDAWAFAELTPDTRLKRNVEPERTAAGRQVDPKSYPWLDPAVMRELVEPVRVHLAILDPPHEAEYTKNAEAYRAEIDSIDREIRQSLNQVPARRVLAVRPVWGAFCKHYGFSLLTPVIGTEGTLSPAEFRELAKVAKASEIKTIFVDASTTTAIRQQIEEKTGLKTMELDAMGSSAADGRNTWGKLMRFNAEELKKGLE
jgi:ABC-type Zn uptake system ZnuABC Zn-binding protein ZnuA